LVHVVALTYELVLLHHRPNNWVPTLDLEDFLRGSVEGFKISCSDVPRESVQNLMVVKFSRELEKFRCFMWLLSGGVPDGLVSRSRLGSVVLCYFPWHVANQWALVYLRGDLKHSFVKALLDDLSDGRLRESAGVDFLGWIVIPLSTSVASTLTWMRRWSET
jgi:hypothetical protein